MEFYNDYDDDETKKVPNYIYDIAKYFSIKIWNETHGIIRLFFYYN